MFSSPQESTESSNTTIEDEDVKGTRAVVGGPTPSPCPKTGPFQELMLLGTGLSGDTGTQSSF